MHTTSKMMYPKTIDCIIVNTMKVIILMLFKVKKKKLLNGLSTNRCARMTDVFGKSSYNSLRSSFMATCKRLAQKLRNPRLLQIHFHTLRHWKATMLYHQTKDILFVKKFLGHRSIESTLIYIQLEEALFQESDEFTVRVAENLDEATKLLEAGFEYVTDMTNCEGGGIVKIFRKRK